MGFNVRFVLLAHLHLSFASTKFPSEADRVIEVGKQQYSVLHEKTKMPSYGECWKSAIQNLHEGCQALTEDVQSDVALGFTNCFLKMSGHETYNCHFLGGVARRECLQGTSDRAFNVYTEFYTHTQNICFYLRSQLWHEETENTINKLTFASGEASKQLEDLLDNTVNLKNALVDSHVNLRTMMQDFHESASEQKRLLFDVFDRLSALQAWAVGEISWLDTVVFYLSGMIVSHLLTSTPRTQGARLFLFFGFSANIVVERYLSHYLVSGSADRIDNLNENLEWWVWMCRKILISVSCVILAVSVFKYKDYNLINHTLLVQIQEQNMKLLGSLEKIKMLQGTIHTLPGSNTSAQGTLIDIDSEDERFVTTQQSVDREMLTSPSKLLSPIPTTTAAVLRKAEHVITSALQSSYALPDHLDIVRNTPSPSRSSRSSHSTISSRSRRKLIVEPIRGRYNLRSPKSEDAI